MEFSTYDKDNDVVSDGNCVDHFAGANWRGRCGSNNMNGKYGGNGYSGYEFMNWYNFDNNLMALKSMTLMFRQAD